MTTAAQGSFGENCKFDCTRTPHTTVAVPVTAMADSSARNSKGIRFHIDTLSCAPSTERILAHPQQQNETSWLELAREGNCHDSPAAEALAPGCSFSTAFRRHAYRYPPPLRYHSTHC